MATTHPGDTWTDDTGTPASPNEDGTLLQNSWLQSFIAKIDQMFAGGAGYETFVFGGLLSSEKVGVHPFSAGAAGANTIRVVNTSAGTGNLASVELGNNADVDLVRFEGYSDTFTETNVSKQDGGALRVLGDGGLSLAAEHASGAIRLVAAGTTKIATVDGDRISLTGGAPGAYALGGTLKDSVNTTQTGTSADTNKTTLHSYSLKANTLATNGERITITAFGTFAANANSKNIGIDFGAQVLADVEMTLDSNTLDWKMTAEVIRTGAETQKAQIEMHSSQSTPTGTAQHFIDFTSPTETLSDAITIAIHATNGTATANDIVCEASWVDWHPVV